MNIEEKNFNAKLSETHWKIMNNKRIKKNWKRIKTSSQKNNPLSLANGIHCRHSNFNEQFFFTDLQ